MSINPDSLKTMARGIASKFNLRLVTDDGMAVLRSHRTDGYVIIFARDLEYDDGLPDTQYLELDIPHTGPLLAAHDLMVKEIKAWLKEKPATGASGDGLEVNEFGVVSP